MTASEHERHELAAKLEELLGPDQAATLMEHLPPVPWDALARQDDLLALRHDVDGLRGDVDGLKGELLGLRGEVTRTNDRVDHLTAMMELRFESLGDRITAHVADRVDSQTKLLVLSILVAVLTATAVALGSNVL